MAEISINITNAILYGAARCGVNAGKVIRAVGVDPACLSDPEARISFDTQMAIWDEATRRSGDRDFGLHLAEAIPTEILGVVAHVAMASNTLGDALDRFLEYSRLVNATSDYGLESLGRETHLTYRLNCAPWILPRHTAEGSIGIIWFAIRKMLGPTIKPIEVGFQHSRPQNTREHRRIFGAPVHFDRQVNELVFDGELLRRPFETANPELLTDYAGQAQDMLNRLPKADPLVQQVRRAIYDSLGSGDLAMQSIARKLDMSVHTLRRRLGEHGNSFQSILSSMRRDLALVYLENSKWTTMDVAFVLGFSDPASFKRTFKRWVGKTPGDYRKTIFK
ncbi:MAG: AraC family transcriptional regulator [Proteobacteria bacterium]|nr:AraC family transcriptional regulator [Pseudomonadota bacterium]